MTCSRSLSTIVLASVVGALALGAACSAENAKPWEKPGTKVGDEITGPDGGKMVWVPAGGFIMGSPTGEGEADERPAHRVRITKGFWLGRCTVTQAQYRRYCQEAAAVPPRVSAPAAQGDDCPVVDVGWAEAEAYCSHYGLSLPTEAQWEYSARGPKAHKYPWGNEWDPKRCCNDPNQDSESRPFPVGGFPQGASWCGALEMASNLWQWCNDWYSRDYYDASPNTDPPGPHAGESRVLRGGSWRYDAYNCRSVSRFCSVVPGGSDFYGFRCSKTP